MKLNLSLPFDKKKGDAYYTKLVEKGAMIDLTEFKPKRSIQHNKFFHVVVGYFCNETGYTMEEGKTVLKREFGSFMIYDKNGKRFIRSSSDCDDKELSLFIDWIRQFCMDQFGLLIPDAEEYRANQFEIEKELQHIL